MVSQNFVGGPGLGFNASDMYPTYEEYNESFQIKYAVLV